MSGAALAAVGLADDGVPVCVDGPVAAVTAPLRGATVEETALAIGAGVARPPLGALPVAAGPGTPGTRTGSGLVETGPVAIGMEMTGLSGITAAGSGVPPPRDELWPGAVEPVWPPGVDVGESIDVAGPCARVGGVEVDVPEDREVDEGRSSLRPDAVDPSPPAAPPATDWLAG